MKINEYIVVNNKEKHPKLKEKNVIEWNDDFLEYSKIVKFLNDNFYQAFAPLNANINHLIQTQYYNLVNKNLFH